MYQNHTQGSSLMPKFITQIKPSKELEWQPCYTEDDPTLVCARLIVPMDYENCASNQTVTLAVIKRPAQDTENYLGPVFINPGVRFPLNNAFTRSC